MRRSCPARTLALFAALTMASLPARGSPGGEGGNAQRLFIEGRAALARGDHATACARFRSSLALAAVPNTLFNVAQCEEHDGKLRDALETWRRGIDLLEPGDDRLKLASARAAALDGKVPQLSLRFDPAVPVEARIAVDGLLVSLEARTAPLRLDIGTHTIEVEISGQPPQRLTVNLSEGDRKEVPIAPAPIAREERPDQGPRPPPPPPRLPPAPHEHNARRTAGFVAAGVGVAGLAAAAITGGILVDRNRQIQEQCKNKMCSPKGRELIDGGGPLFIGNGVAWGVGLAGAGVGAFLLLTSIDDTRKKGALAPLRKAALAPLMLPGGGGALMTGRF